MVEVRTLGAREGKDQEPQRRRRADRAKVSPQLLNWWRHSPLSIAPAQRCLRATPPLRASGGLLVSRQPLTRRANQRAAFARAPAVSAGRKDPAGPRPARPALAPPGGRPRGGGRGGEARGSGQAG